MAVYDNSHWMLVYIKDSFMYSDKTGKAESVMIKDDFPKILQSKGMMPLPGTEDSDEEDFEPLTGSSDIETGNLSNFDKEYSYRQRTNTAQRLERLDMERKKASKIKHIKWEYNPNNINLEEQKELFKKKDLPKITSEDKTVVKKSMLSEQLEKCEHVPLNPFMAYAKFDGEIHMGGSVKKMKIFISMLPKDQRSYPLNVAVNINATIEEFIGLICYKCFNLHPEIKLHRDLCKYGLYITEEDGEVDRDFPFFEPHECIAKFDFQTLALAELQPNEKDRHNTVKMFTTHKNEIEKLDKIQDEVANDLAKMASHANAMEAPLYQSYRVYIINKVRTKTEVQLEISGEKIEINPIVTSKGPSRFWHRQRAISYNMDNIAYCELTECKGSKTVFTLVISLISPYFSKQLESLNISISSVKITGFGRASSYKNHDFEAEASVAKEIVSKINHILLLKNSEARKEYLSHRERTAGRRKSFHVHR